MVMDDIYILAFNPTFPYSTARNMSKACVGSRTHQG